MKLRHRAPWGADEIEYLKLNYATVAAKDIAKHLNRPNSSIYRQAGILGLKKDVYPFNKGKKLDEFVSPEAIERIKATQFKTGDVPFNKGKKLKEFVSPEGIARMRKTQFKKGELPHNHKPVGSERIDKNGYVLVKTKEPNKWELKHRVAWKKLGRKIPKGHTICFINGDKRDFRPENLGLLDRSNLMRYNSVQNLPEELRSAIARTRALNNQIKKAKCTQ